MKRGPKRDWFAARDKCDREGCRICNDPAEAAHVIARQRDRVQPLRADEAFDLASGAWVWVPYAVHPDRIVPLCPRHHRTGEQAYDAGTLDLSPHLTLPEQLQAVADAGSIHLALKRIQGRAYEPAPHNREELR